MTTTEEGRAKKTLSGAEVRRLAAQVKDLDLKGVDAAIVLKSLGFTEKNTLDGSYWKMRAKDCYLIPMDLLCKPLCPLIQRWAIGWNGMCLTARIRKPRRAGNECSLSDILEKEVPQRYFLSKEETALIFEKTQRLKGTEYLKSKLKPGWNIADFRNDEGLRVRKELISPALRAASAMCPIYVVNVPVGTEVGSDGSHV